MKRIGMFLDVSNLYYCVAKHFAGKRLDYNKLLELARQDGEVTKAVCYGAQLAEEAQAFISCLKHMGFETKYKTPKVYRDAKNPNKEVRKANWDIGIAVDILKVISRLDMVILGSADGDFTPLVQYLTEQGVAVKVIGCEISRELKDAASEFMEVDDMMLESKFNETTKTT